MMGSLMQTDKGLYPRRLAPLKTDRPGVDAVVEPDCGVSQGIPLAVEHA